MTHLKRGPQRFLSAMTLSCMDQQAPEMLNPHCTEGLGS